MIKLFILSQFKWYSLWSWVMDKKFNLTLYCAYNYLLHGGITLIFVAKSSTDYYPRSVVLGRCCIVYIGRIDQHTNMNCGLHKQSVWRSLGTWIDDFLTATLAFNNVPSMFSLVAVKWTSWCLKTPAISLPVWQLAPANIKGNIKPLNLLSFVREIRWWPVDSLTKGQ